MWGHLSVAKPPRRRSKRAAPPPLCLRVRVRCRPPSPIAPVPRCPPRRRTLEPLPRSSGSLPSPSCHHLAKGCAPSAPSLPCRCPCSPAFPPLAACKVFEAMPEPRAASIAPTNSSLLRSKGYLAWLGSFPLLWSVARWFSLTFSMLRTTGISDGGGR
jgi:hypothetical protein